MVFSHLFRIGSGASATKYSFKHKLKEHLHAVVGET